MGSLRKRKKPYGRFGLFLVLFLMTGTVSYATEGIDQEIDQQQEEIDRTEQEIRDTEQRRKKLEDAKASMENYLADLNKQYASISEELEDLQGQIEEKKQEIEQTQADLEEARQIEEKQYRDMKIRIQYMYENPRGSFFAILLEGGSFSEALNEYNYAASIAAYDKQMMENYVAQKEAIADKEAQLEGEKEALDELHASVEAKQQEVSALAKNTSSQIGQHVNQM